MKEIIETQRTVDKILDNIENNLYLGDVIKAELEKSISPEQFKSELEFEFIYTEKHFRISKTYAKKAFSKWPMHMHPDSVEVIVITKGRGIVYWGNNSKEMKQNDCLPLPKGVMHGGFSLEDDSEMLCICIPPDPLSEKFEELIKQKNGS